MGIGQTVILVAGVIVAIILICIACLPEEIDRE